MEKNNCRVSGLIILVTAMLLPWVVEAREIPLAKKGNLEIVAVWGEPDYVRYPANKAMRAANSGFDGLQNLNSYAISYKGWNLIGEYAYSVAFYWERNPNELRGKTETVNYHAISKYPDLVKRYNAINPTRVDFDIRVWVKTADGKKRQVVIKVADEHLIYFGSRSSQNYVVPTSPLKWKHAISLAQGISAEQRFTDSDPSSENELKRMVTNAVAIDDFALNVVDLRVRWPSNEIDEIARLFRKYERGEPTPRQQVEREAARAQKLRRQGDSDATGGPSEIPLQIELEDDGTGGTTANGVVELKGRVKGPIGLIRRGKLVAEGYEQDIEIDPQGRFSRHVVLRSGTNDIKVTAGSHTASRQIVSTRAPVKLRATLTWNSGNSDIDLHLTNPKGVTVSYRNKSAGGMQLDVDNTRGYGPENIYVGRTEQGRYTIRVQNYARGIGTEATVHVFVDERLRDVHKVRFTSDREMITVSSYDF